MSNSPTIVLTVNGSVRDVAVETTVIDIISLLEVDPRGIAVALNGTVIPKSRWAQTPLNDADEVEIVTAAAGG